MRHLPGSIRIALLLLALDSLLWFAYGVAAAYGTIASITQPPLIRWAMAGLAWAGAAALAVLALMLKRRTRPAFFVSVSLLALIAVLSITDQVGLVDLVTLAVSPVPLGLLLKDRAWYLRRTDSPGGATTDDPAIPLQDPV